jgi:arylformamidase
VNQSPAVRTKGPLVFLDMDQQALDDAYDQEVYAPNRALVVERRKAASERARAVLGAPKRLTYGPGEHEGLDVFDCGIKGAPFNVFVHGGAWRRNVAADYALQAEPLVRAGAHCVIIDFINVDQAKGDLFPMYEQVRRALAWVWNGAQGFGGDRDRLYDLAPVALSKRSVYVNFTPAMIEKLSGGRYIGSLNTPLVLAYGTCETPEFQRQTRDFAAAVQAAGKPVELLVGEAYNHFELLETLANPYGLTGRAMLKQMGLAQT